jgi:hypothetical protein
MRKLVVGALVGVLALAVAAIAMAASATSGTTVQNYQQTFTSKKPNASTGTQFSTSSTDEANTSQNKQPKRVTNFDITFPKGTKIDTTSLPTCAATEPDFNGAENPDDACPPRSRIGGGTVAARLDVPNTGDLSGTVSAYNAKKGLLLYVVIQSPIGNQTLLLKPKLSGVKLLTPVPHTCIPPNRPDQDCRENGGTGDAREAILTSFTLKVKAGKTGKKVYMTTPKACPSGGWPFEANIKYADKTAAKIKTKSPCKK